MSALLDGFAPPPIIADGAWGTELLASGLPPGQCAESWNIAHPDRVERVARSYVQAGSQVILTNTMGANRISLTRHGLADQVVALNRAGAEISRRAAGSAVRVFASVGPTGRLLAAGEVTEAELREVYREQCEALAEAGVDALLLETFSDLAEIRTALASAKSTGLPVVASLVFDSGAARDRTMMGTTPEQAAEALLGAGADAIGANCGRGITGTIPICRRFRAISTGPLWLKPNAGLPELVDGRAVYQTSAEEFAEQTAELVAAGASFVGGCCGTSPTFISALVRTLRG